MKVYRWQHINYNPIDENIHRLLLDTLNNHTYKYPCPDEDEVFENDTRSCFKTKETAEEFRLDMNALYYDDIEYYSDEAITGQRPEMYELLEYTVNKNDIVFIDDFQVIHETKGSRRCKN